MRCSITALQPTDRRSIARNLDAIGDPGELFAQYHQELLRCCTNILGNPEDAAEVVQATFVRYLRKREQFRGDASIRTYLYRIAVNLCKNAIRSHNRANRTKSVPLHLCGDIADSPMPERESIWALEAALRTLKPSLRHPLVLHAMEGMDYGEIARILKITASGVRSRVHRAKRYLKQRLEREGACL